ncbi:hypothetical protein Vadar_007720 [Vaccinium darrowii]|uniref:Uncharacterized protein n=1 Tax=Vaccinium darrowii TaxID=229202 RepID=A0ACB7X884_9ERIC|nr:hypothetical protein Vadar_007720 [Vaccinium darrowii]
MEQSLCEAAITGNIDSLRRIIEKDGLILEKVVAGCFSGPNPLHIATSNNKLHFVEELLGCKPELAEVLDSQLRSALHLASAKGHDEIVKVLVEVRPDMCLVRDRDGKNPLHLAAEKGEINVLEELVRASPQAARARVDRNETILHLCVKNNQLKSLEILLEKIQGEELVNAKDNDGNTILHLAVLDTQFETQERDNLFEVAIMVGDIIGKDASNKKEQLVEGLLRLKPGLVEVLDSQLRSALHLASAKGDHKIVTLLVNVGPQMCLARDRDGKNPLHVAAVKGRINVLEQLVRINPQAARDRVDRNETILHLCVRHNQLDSLELLLDRIQSEEFVNAKDNDGNTILHLSIFNKQIKITSLVLKNTTIDVNAENESGHTAMDILFLLQAGSDKKDLDTIEDLLRQANAKQGKDLVGGHWLKKKKNSLMVVASLIATMAFQAGVNPPGGVWQDDRDGHRAGEAVMAYNYQDSYPYFLRFNTIGFVASLSTILLLNSGLKFKNKASLWSLIVSMWLAITSMAITYAFANVVVTPKKDRQSLSYIIVIGVTVWTSVMTLLLIYHTCHLVAIFVKEERSRKSAIKRLMNLRDGLSILRKRLSSSDRRSIL